VSALASFVGVDAVDLRQQADRNGYRL